MSNAKKKINNRQAALGAGRKQMKLATWGVLAGLALTAPVFSGDSSSQRPESSGQPTGSFDLPTVSPVRTPVIAVVDPAPATAERPPVVTTVADAAPATQPATAPTAAPTTAPAVEPLPIVSSTTTPATLPTTAPATTAAPEVPATPAPAATASPASPAVPAPAAPETPAPAATASPASPAVPAPIAPATAAAPDAPAASDEPQFVAKGIDRDGLISLMVNKSRVVTTKVPIKRVNVAQTEIVDVLPVTATELLLTAKRPGSTHLVLWDAQDRSQAIEVVVSSDIRGLETQMKSMFPKASIKVEAANGAVVLRGHVPDLVTAQQATAVAAPYSATKEVLNFMEVSGGQQVLLQVRFAEVTRSVNQSLGFNAFASDGKFAFGLGNGPIGAQPNVANSVGNAAFPLYGGGVAGNASFEMFLTALRNNGLLRDLAEPNLVAISGQDASFLAGGEIPIPVPQPGGGSTGITIEYKKFGIQLKFTPTVLGDGRVRLHCAPEVSQLDYAHAVVIDGGTVPALTTRNVDTTVELAEGQTFALAGLLDNRITASKNITPVLGDLPILGALFRSVNYQRQETELVVLVTPRLVEAMNPNQVPTIPGEIWRDPTEHDLFVHGDLGGPGPDIRHAPVGRTSQYYGHAGFYPAPVIAPAAAAQK